MIENISLRIGACILCCLIGFAFWPALLLAGLIGFALIDELRDPEAVLAQENSKKTSVRISSPQKETLSSTRGSEVHPTARPVQVLGDIKATNIIVPSRPKLPTTSKRELLQKQAITKSKLEPNTNTQGLEESLPSEQKADRRNLQSMAERREIPHLVHFTRCENLPSILRHGLRSISRCDDDNIDAIRNDMMRLDGHPDGISMSVTFPNFRMFYKYRQLDVTADWAVLLVSSKVLWEKECGFHNGNAAASQQRKLLREKTETTQAFQGMFDTPSWHREHWLRQCDPTDPQAEVMVYETIEPHLIETVAFETKSVSKKWSPVLKGIDYISAGEGKGLFGSRSKVRLH